MTVKDIMNIPTLFDGADIDTQIQVFTNVKHPASLLSLEYCPVNDVIYLKYEIKEEAK